MQSMMGLPKEAPWIKVFSTTVTLRPQF